MQSFKKITFLVLFVFPLTAFGVDSQSSVFVKPEIISKSAISEAFRHYKDISPSISVPTVIEVPFGQQSFPLPVFAVYNNMTSQFEPSFFKQSVTQISTGSTVQAQGSLGNTNAIQDGNYETYVEFPLHEGLNTADVTFMFTKPIVTSSLAFALDNYVALPQTISISAIVSNKPYTVLANTRLSGGIINFPKTTSSAWRVTFSHVQPLRISEMKFNELYSGQTVSSGLRFLAQPGQSYRIYFDADRYVQSTRKEAGDLSTNKGVVRVADVGANLNSEYKPVDSDNDSIADLNDNCVSISNTDQKDSDSNGLGDVCEDYDRDGLVTVKDNCPLIPNRDQMDTDKDGVGDVCDTYENRTTERLPWLPWVGIGVAGVVLLGLFVLVLKYKKDDMPAGPTSPTV